MTEPSPEAWKMLHELLPRGTRAIAAALQRLMDRVAAAEAEADARHTSLVERLREIIDLYDVGERLGFDPVIAALVELVGRKDQVHPSGQRLLEWASRIILGGPGYDRHLQYRIATGLLEAIRQGRREMATLVLNTPRADRDKLCLDELQGQAREGVSTLDDPKPSS